MRRYTAVQPFTLSLPYQPLPGGAYRSDGTRVVRAGDLIEVGELRSGHPGHGALPLREARLADGTVGTLGRHITEENGYLAPVENATSDPVAAAVAFVQQVASLTMDGEYVDGEPFRMESDDARDTVNALIGQARHLGTKGTATV